MKLNSIINSDVPRNFYVDTINFERDCTCFNEASLSSHRKRRNCVIPKLRMVGKETITQCVFLVNNCGIKVVAHLGYEFST